MAESPVDVARSVLDRVTISGAELPAMLHMLLAPPIDERKAAELSTDSERESGGKRRRGLARTTHPDDRGGTEPLEASVTAPADELVGPGRSRP
jgi:hypothetical protein